MGKEKVKIVSRYTGHNQGTPKSIRDLEYKLSVLQTEQEVSIVPGVTFVHFLSKISEEEIERIMSGQEFEEEANHWSNHGDSDHSSPGNRASESNQPSPGSTLSSR